MAIDLSRYVDITSGVGAGASVRPRDLIGRIFSINPLIPPGVPALEFTTAAAVGAYFGLTSEEYLRSVFYFGWISKNITRPKKIGFSRWVNVATAPHIFGNVQTQTIGAWNLITAGSFKLTIGATQNSFTALDFSAAADLAGVASILQTAIRTGTGTQWTAATVVWNSVRGSFDFTGGDNTVAATISVQIGTTGTNIAQKIGWIYDSSLSTTNTLILTNGALVETITQTLTTSATLTNNFGSFLFQPALSIEQITEAAVWNDGQNIKYQYMVPIVSANVTDLYLNPIKPYSGTAVTLSEISGQYPEMVPMMILAATDYLAANSVQNYMFQMFALTYGVSTDATADLMDAQRVNYYGRTQTAGQFLDFYQRGLLMGLTTAPTDMNTYANEQWLKDAAGVAIMTLLIALTEVSANSQGRSQILCTLQSVIDQALTNGTISVGKKLTTVQKLYITELTNDPNAWYQVQTIGYWVDCVIVPVTFPDLHIEYQATYTLVYSKDDVIRKVNGTHVLI